MESDPEVYSCPICGRRPADGVLMRNAGVFDGLTVTCPQCGTYSLVGAEAHARSRRWSAELKLALSCATRQASEAEAPLWLEGSNAEDFANQHLRTRAQENQNRLLREIAKRIKRPGYVTNFDTATDFTLIDCLSVAEFTCHLQWLIDQGLGVRTGSFATDAKIGLSLTLEGWNRVQPEITVGGNPGRCFVAMWFDSSMEKAWELGIFPAVKDCGLPDPIRIDLKEHNNQITDEIMAEIRGAEFVVADFSGNRGGVYYEAGFARGIGRPVIYCCDEASF